MVNCYTHHELHIHMLSSIIMDPTQEVRLSYERTGFERIGRPRLTKYELARVIGTRACQIANNDPPKCDIPVGSSAVRIAQMELAQKLYPAFEIRRYHADGTWERWTLTELIESECGVL